MPPTGTRAAFRQATIAIVLLGAAASAPEALGQAANGAGAPDPYGEPGPIPLYGDALGSHGWQVTSASAGAQEYFDQGVRLMYAYAPTEANASFAEARRLDAGCAMCWWGQAWALGPYLNGAMSGRAIPAAQAASQRAQALASGATPIERALIDAMVLRYQGRVPAEGDTPQDSAWADALAAAHGRFPASAEVATLYADALMLLEPRRGVWPLEKPAVRRIHEVLEGVLARDVGHPGACHAYVHATETTPRVHAAQACADLLGRSIPGASHINHMPSHTYNRVGRWGDATRANIEAWHTDLRAGRNRGFAIYPSHNLHMLLFSAAMDGQGAIAIQAAGDYARMDPSMGPAYRAVTLVRFGRFEEVLELPGTPSAPIAAGLLAFGRGLAHLRLGEADSARSSLSRIDSIMAASPEGPRFRQHSPAQLLGIAGGILRGEIHRVEGRMEEALGAFSEAVRIEAGLTYDEPEPLSISPRDFLGAALLEAGRPAEAREVYEAALVARPHNGWSLKGLEVALRAEGRGAEAEEARRRFEKAWERSEVLLEGSRF